MTSPLHIYDEPHGHGAKLNNAIAKDICFLYHELAPYNYIMSDLDYREFTLDYWTALNRIDGGHYDDQFNNDCVWAYDVFVRSYFAKNASRPKMPKADEHVP